MRRNLSKLVAATLAIAAVSACAIAGETQRVKLDLSAAPAAASEIAVSGSAGRYDHLDAHALPATLRLAAEMTDDGIGFRMLKSQLFLKSEGAVSAPGIDPLDGAAPQRSFAAEREIRFAFAANGPVAQSAIASCNGLASGGGETVRLPLAVVWRVTTGRFNYKWTGYDQVAPSDDIIANRDFYSEQATTDVEAILDVTVRCAPLHAAPASIAATKARVEPVVSKAHFTPAEKETPAAAPAAPADARIVKVEPEAPRVALIASKPVCDGGMVRQVSGADAGYLCLCPGNTERIATGENAFQCEKRSRRR